ncbi:hypothetical protein LTR16_002717 [Cryomyces antarcticus]|uniref:Protein HRI1 n=1 Tax=Cryomyces antarcticus TaxID=329879 RepID=A0ABR0M7B0_9PEZI|nr:hypothetical protein LTR60_001868 [Cryomyces antarcticus]KAK5290110.1 hypothetical protein LTR16_002717 [Cryomyces antarcticus]
MDRKLIVGQNNEPASEPTSTLVLTTGQSRYIDIRIFRSREGEPDLPNEGGPLDRLEWAFAGVSHSELKEGGNENIRAAHCVWQHWVDSRTLLDEPPLEDKGDLYQQPDGTTLEVGAMVNPRTGLMTQYQELWEEPLVECTGKDEKRLCICLTVDNPSLHTRGVVVRVGQWCEGIIRVGDEVSIERWKWVPKGQKIIAEGTTAEGDWERQAKIGRIFLPCALTFVKERVEVGNTVEVGGLTWDIMEKYEW